MKRNMGPIDRLVFAGLAVVIVLAVPADAAGWLPVLAYVAAGLLAAMSAIGYCPLYEPFHIDLSKRA